jgi:hypothetical protein
MRASQDCPRPPRARRPLTRSVACSPKPGKRTSDVQKDQTLKHYPLLPLWVIVGITDTQCDRWGERRSAGIGRRTRPGGELKAKPAPGRPSGSFVCPITLPCPRAPCGAAQPPPPPLRIAVLVTTSLIRSAQPGALPHRRPASSRRPQRPLSLRSSHSARPCSALCRRRRQSRRASGTRGTGSRKSPCAWSRTSRTHHSPRSLPYIR